MTSLKRHTGLVTITIRSTCNLLGMIPNNTHTIDTDTILSIKTDFFFWRMQRKSKDGHFEEGRCNLFIKNDVTLLCYLLAVLQAKTQEDLKDSHV